MVFSVATTTYWFKATLLAPQTISNTSLPISTFNKCRWLDSGCSSKLMIFPILNPDSFLYGSFISYLFKILLIISINSSLGKTIKPFALIFTILEKLKILIPINLSLL